MDYYKKYLKYKSKYKKLQAEIGNSNKRKQHKCERQETCKFIKDTIPKLKEKGTYIQNEQWKKVENYTNSTCARAGILEILPVNDDKLNKEYNDNLDWLNYYAKALEQRGIKKPESICKK